MEKNICNHMHVVTYVWQGEQYGCTPAASLPPWTGLSLSLLCTLGTRRPCLACCFVHSVLSPFLNVSEVKEFFWILVLSSNWPWWWNIFLNYTSDFLSDNLKSLLLVSNLYRSYSTWLLSAPFNLISTLQLPEKLQDSPVIRKKDIM